jgi:hypothetical protein
MRRRFILQSQVKIKLIGERYDVYDFVREKGIPLEKDYPYLAYDQDQCMEFKSQFKIKGYTNNTANDHQEIMTSLEKMPVGISLYASAFAFRFYESGIFFHR